MIIILDKKISLEDQLFIKDSLISKNQNVTLVKTQFANYFVAIGNKDFDIREIGYLKGVSDIFISKSLFPIATK